MARIAQEVRRAYAACAAALVSGGVDLDAIDALGLNVEMPGFTVSQAAQIAGVHPQTLRAYEQKGLVTPQRTSGNTRMYSQADIERLGLINELTNEGINLAGVTRILDLQGRLDARDEEIDDLHKRVRRLADRVHELETRESVNSLVRASDMPTALRRLP